MRIVLKNEKPVVSWLDIFLWFNNMKGEKKMQSELQEVQRYGRNKNTTVNHSYINSGEYRNEFD